MIFLPHSGALAGKVLMRDIENFNFKVFLTLSRTHDKLVPVKKLPTNFFKVYIAATFIK
jgi:hypothetical protein